MRKYMVERYLPGMTAEEVDDSTARLALTAEALAAEGLDVRYAGSTYVPQEESCFCRFEASSRGVVENVCERARSARYPDERSAHEQGTRRPGRRMARCSR